jgi:CHAT domain-containing protein
MHEVSGLKINAGLVTLSACQSGVGRLESADELVSLSRAFLYAGTHSILSTLWRVDDISTSLLAKHFYRHYAGHVLGKDAEGPGGAPGNTKADSLRYAQLQVMNDTVHYHPMYWAGMILAGDYR